MFVSVPVPGGCNQVFPLEIYPMMQLTWSDHFTRLWFQWASDGGGNVSLSPRCDNDVEKKLMQYDIYVSYVNPSDMRAESLFSIIQAMSSVGNVKSNGQKVGCHSVTTAFYVTSF